MGVTYANFDLVCRFLSSLVDKSAMFLTEQKQNMGRIKEKRKCMQSGRQFVSDIQRAVFKTHL